MFYINAEPCKSANASTPPTWDRLPISLLSHRLLPSRARNSWQRGLSWYHACSAYREHAVTLGPCTHTSVVAQAVAQPPP